MFVVTGCSRGIICLIQKPFQRPRKRQRYSLIDDGEESTMRGKPQYLVFFLHLQKRIHSALCLLLLVLNKSVMVSESESDSDVLFNVRDKNGYDPKNGKKPRNGFVKLGKRIKT